jgi:hypothetical protein
VNMVMNLCGSIKKVNFLTRSGYVSPKELCSMESVC